jgi:hypothetical protein
MIAVRHAAITASRTTPLIAAFTKMDWSAIGLICSAGGNWSRICGNCAFTSEMMLSVDALPVFCTVINDARCPSTRTILV